MAFFDSQFSVFLIQDVNGTERNLSAFVTSLEGLPGERTVNQVTAFGDAGQKHLPSIEDGNFNIEGMYDSTGTATPDPVLSALRTATASRTFKYGPEGTGSGKRRYTGVCWERTYVVTSRVGNAVGYRAEFLVDGATTTDTF